MSERIAKSIVNTRAQPRRATEGRRNALSDGIATPAESPLNVSRYKGGRFWAVREAGGTLVCLCVYRKGTNEVVRRISHNRGISNTSNTSGNESTEPSRSSRRQREARL